jgi:hypothetical protein
MRVRAHKTTLFRKCPQTHPILRHYIEGACTGRDGPDPFPANQHCPMTTEETIHDQPRAGRKLGPFVPFPLSRQKKATLCLVDRR